MDDWILPPIRLKTLPKEELNLYATQLINANSHSHMAKPINFSKAKGEKGALKVDKNNY